MNKKFRVQSSEFRRAIEGLFIVQSSRQSYLEDPKLKINERGERSMLAKRFEDLLFWQKARELTKLVYTLTREGAFKMDFGLRDQIQRSAVSVMSNIAEGFGRGGNNEFIQFLFTAKGSVSEVKSQLYVAIDMGYITDAEFRKAYDMTEEIARMINSFIKSLKSASRKGLKTD